MNLSTTDYYDFLNFLSSSKDFDNINIDVKTIESLEGAKRITISFLKDQKEQERRFEKAYKDHFKYRK